MRSFRVCVVALSSLLSYSLIGCSNNPAPIDPNEVAKTNHIDQVVTNSGGDWNKLSQSDKDFMIKTVGDEKGAQMLLLAKSGKLRATPGAPPASSLHLPGQ